ncbi:hypothetical protein ABVC73_00880 [Prevotella melaninogenica]
MLFRLSAHRNCGGQSRMQIVEAVCRSFVHVLVKNGYCYPYLIVPRSKSDKGTILP